jgi:hypothetical protein
MDQMIDRHGQRLRPQGIERRQLRRDNPPLAGQHAQSLIQRRRARTQRCHAEGRMAILRVDGIAQGIAGRLHDPALPPAVLGHAHRQAQPAQGIRIS